MAIMALLSFLLFPLSLLAQSNAEQAIMLNEEMNQLMKSATDVKVWAAPGTSSRSGIQRNGVAPSQMKGVENLEDRYFSDDVTFQAAASDRINEEDPYADSELEEDKPLSDYRLDGTAPKKRR